MPDSNCNNLITGKSSAVVGVAFGILAIFILGVLPAAADETSIDAAIADLGQAVGQSIDSQSQAQTICDQEKYFETCAEIGKRHGLYEEEEIKQVDAVLNEIKGAIAQNLQNCQTVECLVGVANELAAKIAESNPAVAQLLDLTPKVVQKKEAIMEAAREIGVTYEDCKAMDPDTASVDLLRACARLAKDSRVQEFVPEQVKQVAGQTDKMINLREALTKGEYQCGDNTVNSCGNYCLNIPAGSTIPQVCRDIAKKFFGDEGEKQLETAQNQVKQVADFYNKKAQAIFTTIDGRKLTTPEQIGNYMEQQGKLGNVEAVEKGMDFMVAQGFITAAERDFALKMVRKIKDAGGRVDFDKCAQDPKACRDYIPEEFQGDFDVADQVLTIMVQEIGFHPDLCEQGQFNPEIGQKCLEGSRRALPKLEALAVDKPFIKPIIQEIKGHIARGDDLANKKDQFMSGAFSGPGGCRSEQECFAYCSDPVHGPECIAFGAKEQISGFKGEEAVAKYQEFNYTIQAPQLAPGTYPNQGPYPYQPYMGPGQPGMGGEAPAFYQPMMSPMPPMPGQYQQPYYPQPYPTYYPPGTGPSYPAYPGGPVGPSPGCISALQAGDFEKAKNLCAVNMPAPPVLRTPVSSPIRTAMPSQTPQVPNCTPPSYWDSVTNSCKYPPSPTGTYIPPGPGTGGMKGCFYPNATKNGSYIGYTVWCEADYYNCHLGDSSGKSVDLNGVSLGAPSTCESGWPNYTPYPVSSPPSGTACPSGQWWDGATQSCTSMSSCGYSQYWDPVSQMCKPSPGYSPGPGCSPETCYDPAYCSDGRDNDNDGFTDMADPGCGGPGPGMPGGGSCPSGYHYHGESGGFCINDQENYGGICYDATGNNKIACPAMPTYSPYPSSPMINCPSGYHYHGESGGFCINDQENYGGICYDATGNNKIACPAMPTYSPYPGATGTTCPSGQYWYVPSSGGQGYCMSSSTGSVSPQSCPSGQYWYYPPSGGPGYCMSSSSPQSCPSGQYWYVPPSGGAGYCMSSSTPPPACPSGQWWDSMTNSCQSSSTGGSCGNGICENMETGSSCPSDCMPASGTQSCPSDQYWFYPPEGGSGYCKPMESMPPPTSGEYSPPPTYEPPPSTYEPPPPPPEEPPPPTSSLYHHITLAHAAAACYNIGGGWDVKNSTCRPGGFSVTSALGTISRLFTNFLK